MYINQDFKGTQFYARYLHLEILFLDRLTQIKLYKFLPQITQIYADLVQRPFTNGFITKHYKFLPQITQIDAE